MNPSKLMKMGGKLISVTCYGQKPAAGEIIDRADGRLMISLGVSPNSRRNTYEAVLFPASVSMTPAIKEAVS
jgi:hypothetical protein